MVTTGAFGTGRLEALNAGGAAQPANFADPAAISSIGVTGPLAGPVNVLTGQSAGGTDLGAVAADYLAGVCTFTGVDEATDCASGDGNACKGYVVVDYNGVLVSSIRWTYWGSERSFGTPRLPVGWRLFSCRVGVAIGGGCRG